MYIYIIHVRGAIYILNWFTTMHAGLQHKVLNGPGPLKL